MTVHVANSGAGWPAPKCRWLATYPLRAGVDVQLGLAWCESQTQGETFVRLDERLREAALQEGFRIVP
jgi:hypothetical protein